MPPTRLPASSPPSSLSPFASSPAPSQQTDFANLDAVAAAYAALQRALAALQDQIAELTEGKRKKAE